MNNDEQRQREVALAIHAALQHCSAIMARWRAGARFSVAAQHDLCQAAMQLHSALGLRLAPRTSRAEPPAEAAVSSAPLGDVAGSG